MVIMFEERERIVILRNDRRRGLFNGEVFEVDVLSRNEDGYPDLIGFDPALVAQTWWDLYADAGLAAVVDPREVPMEPVPA